MNSVERLSARGAGAVPRVSQRTLLLVPALLALLLALGVRNSRAEALLAAAYALGWIQLVGL